MTSGGMPWKGLDTSRMPVFIGYDQVERMIAALVEQAAAWRPDEVVGLTRGGIVPAAMAAGILALPLSFIAHDKATGGIGWIGPPAVGERILLVDDCCSRGTTLHRARAALLAEGRDCLTLVVVHDPDTIRHPPDLSFPMRELFRLPWERGEATPTGRAAKASGDNLDPRVEAPFVGVGLDRTLLPGDLPRLPPGRAVLLSDLPGTERNQIASRLRDTPFAGLPLICRPDATGCDKPSLIRFKAEAATSFGCTHFIDRDAEQAIGIAAHAPHLIVTWWSADERRGWIVGAAMRRDVTDCA